MHLRQKRAAKDAKDRQAKIDTAEKLLKKPELLKKKVRSYYLKETQRSVFELNEDKIAESKRFDGFLAIATNAEQVSVEEALDHYRNLFQIEHTFRTYKNFLEPRPMFHWTDKRIEGHICLCYIAYTLLTYVQNKVKLSNHHLTENQIRSCLDSMQVSLVESEGNYYYLRAKQHAKLELLSQILALNKLPNVMPKSEIDNYL